VNFRDANEFDYDFVKNLHHLTLKEYIEPIWGWDETEQDQALRKWFNPAKVKIIQDINKEIGIVVVIHRQKDIFFESISIIPGYQKQGLGTKIIKNIIDEAKKKQMPIVLQVLKTNHKAKKLYERLGFKVYDDKNEHFYLKLDLPEA